MHAVMPRRLDHWRGGGGYVLILTTGSERSNFTDYSLLNKYILYVPDMLIDVFMLHACIASGGRSAPNFFHFIVRYCGQNNTNWISTSRSVCLVSWSKFTYWFPIVVYFSVGQILPTGTDWLQALEGANPPPHTSIKASLFACPLFVSF